ncbi:MAG TPA: response regulator [Candidatus Acidoferrales bacterium]|nr:response regulator [Candidatus Acidoferrales bacterium]
MSETETLTAARTPTVYFIDDSATMREVIKIAFRKENIQVVTCPDAATALAQFGDTAPDAVITDVIMPDKDGYEVCQFIKQHEQFGRTPVILMSGVVNKAVAEKAMAVKADELVRKPFQPQELIARVKNLLNPRRPVTTTGGGTTGEASGSQRDAAQVLTNLFAPAPAPAPSAVPPASRPSPSPSAGSVTTAPPPAVRAAAPAASVSSAEVQKLRTEVLRLELLVKKLQAALEAEKQYCAALEGHLKTLQEF